MAAPTFGGDGKFDPSFSIPKRCPIVQSCLSQMSASTSLGFDEYVAALTERFQPSNAKISKDALIQDFLRTFNHAFNESEISMIPCFKIHKHFNHEKDLEGEFIVLDIGGSTIRIGIVDLSNRRTPIITQKQWLLSEGDKIIHEDFFENLVDKLIELVGNNKEKFWNIGITWSFPLNTANEIVTMGKGFHVKPEVLGIGVDKIISKICHKKGFNAEVKAIINDSVAVNLSGLINSDVLNSKISFILGTGLNSCVLKNNQLINTELGFFGKLDEVTVYDKKLDSRWNKMKEPYLKNSKVAPIFQPLEFLASGRYIPEILRLIIVELIRDGDLFFKIEKFNKPFTLHGDLICALDPSKSIEEIKSDLKNSSYNLKVNTIQIEILQAIIDIILERSAIYVSCAIRALSQFIDHDPNEVINVNYIGSFLFHCVEFQKKIKHHSDNKIHLNHIENSSLLGAAVAACINSHRIHSSFFKRLSRTL